MGDLFDLQASIVRGGRDAVRKDQVGTIWEGILLDKYIASQGSNVALKAKEDMEKVKSRNLAETAAIKSEVQYAIALFNKIDQGQRGPIETLTNEV